ncbi:hypothetical protein ACJMK2_021666 [Sinanodonta woodiana]|uniref:C1q domain-containing protein n=1 Tax=Sinanodonta woodiana TaxID=1069815 RepID=A0ABD3TIQ2_SINWO
MFCTMTWLIFLLLLSTPSIFSFVIGGDDSDPVSNNIAYLHQLLSEEKNLRSSLETKIQQMEQRLEQRMEKIETNMSTLQKESSRDPTVAFHAYLNKEVGSVQSAHVIFDTVLLNIGNAYSPLHGIFRAPYNGTYLFSMTAVIPSLNMLYFFLKKNDITEEFVFADHMHTNDYTQASKTTVLALNVNDYVWVEASGYIVGSGGDDGHGHIHMRSSFSGFFIKEM